MTLHLNFLDFSRPTPLTLSVVPTLCFQVFLIIIRYIVIYIFGFIVGFVTDAVADFVFARAMEIRVFF